MNSSLLNLIFEGYSPILSHVNTTLQGLSTVRACDARRMLEKEFHAFQDHNTSCYYLFNCASTWFAVWLDVVCLLFTASVTYSFLLLQDCMLIEAHFACIGILFSLTNDSKYSIRCAQWIRWFGYNEQHQFDWNL